MFTSYIKTEGIPDILHAHSALNGGLIATKMGKKYKIPVVITEHSSAFARNLLSSWQKKLARQVFEESDMNIVVSQSLGEDLKKLYGTSIEPCQVIPNMLGSTFEDFEFFSGNKNNQKFCFTSIGSLDPNKAHIDLVKAFHQAFSGNKEVELLIVGTGKISEQIEDYIRENSTLNGRIKLLGDLTRQEVRDTILYSDVYVHSSHYETFGVVLIEALACGKPVISTACGGPNDIVNDKNGILVPVGNINALAASMIYMQKHLHRYNSDSIRSDCVAKYSSGVIVDKLINVYEQLAYF